MMIVEDKLPDLYKRSAYHPSLFVYAWKRKDVERLFDEFLKSNIGIKGGEVWLVEGEKTTSIIPLQSGDIDIFNWKITRKKGEEWYDFVDRSVKETLNTIGEWDLEKKVKINKVDKIWYTFNLAAE